MFNKHAIGPLYLSPSVVGPLFVELHGYLLTDGTVLHQPDQEYAAVIQVACNVKLTGLLYLCDMII